MAKYFAALLLTEMKSTDRSIKKGKKGLGQYPAILTSQAWSILIIMDSLFYSNQRKNGDRKRKKGLFSYLSLLGLVPLSLADLLLYP